MTRTRRTRCPRNAAVRAVRPVQRSACPKNSLQLRTDRTCVSLMPCAPRHQEAPDLKRVVPAHGEPFAVAVGGEEPVDRYAASPFSGLASAPWPRRLLARLGCCPGVIEATRDFGCLAKCRSIPQAAPTPAHRNVSRSTPRDLSAAPHPLASASHPQMKTCAILAVHAPEHTPHRVPPHERGERTSRRRPPHPPRLCRACRGVP